MSNSTIFPITQELVDKFFGIFLRCVMSH